MKLKAQNALGPIEDLDSILDLSTDEALSLALEHSINQELEPELYDEILSKLGDTQQAAFTSGLVERGIRVMSSKQKHVFARAKNHILTKLKNHFINLANKQGCVYENDYHNACYDLTDNYVLGEINTWLISAGLPLKKNRPKFETDYKKKVKDVAKHPNINKLKAKKAKKETSERPELKKKFPDKMPESDLVNKTDYPPLSHLNKGINELKDKEFKTEFLPPWGKKEAQVDTDEDALYDRVFNWLETTVEAYIPPEKSKDTRQWAGEDDDIKGEVIEEFISDACDDLGVTDDQIRNMVIAIIDKNWPWGVEEAAVGQEINMYDDGHFPIGGKKEVQEEACTTPGRKERSKGKGRGLGKGKGKGPLGVPVRDKFAQQIPENLMIQELDTFVDKLDDANLRGFMVRVPDSKFYRASPSGGFSDIPTEQEIEEVYQAAKMEVSRKATVKKAQQEVPFGESDIDEFFESGLEFEQAPKTEQVAEGDIVRVQRFQELQSKQAQGILTPDEEIELSALTEELGPMMPALAKAYRQAQKEKKIFVIDKTKKEEPVEESPEEKKKKRIQDILKQKEQEDLDRFKSREAQMSSGQGLEAEKQKLESQINSQFATSVESQQWLQAVHDAPDWPAVAQIWTQLFGGYMEQPQQMEQRWPDVEPEEYGFVELQNSRTKDPVEASIQKVAQKEFHSATTKKKVQFANASFMTHIAQTEVQKAAGLEAFDALNPSEGMLFPFDKPSHVTFHMGSVKFPIDIIFLMEEPTALKVAKIIHNAQPGAVEYWSCANTSYVLEIVGGTAKKNEIKIDSECFVKDRILPKG